MAQLQRVNPFSSHTMPVMNGPLLSDGDLFLGQLWVEGGALRAASSPCAAKPCCPALACVWDGDLP